jgi:hypothetical protein
MRALLVRWELKEFGAVVGVLLWQKLPREDEHDDTVRYPRLAPICRNTEGDILSRSRAPDMLQGIY